MDVSQPINFKIKTLNHPDSQLQIKYLEPTSYEISKPLNELEAQTNSQLTVSDTEEAVTVELNFTFEGREPIVTKAAIFPNKIKGEGEREAIYPTSVYISVGTSFNLGAEAERYDQLNRDNLIPKYEQLLRRTVIPNLRRTSLGIENGVTMIHGDVGYGLVPLTLLGSGGRRLNSILLALTSSKDGVVLIDEIENSFHHSVLDGVWTAIAEIVESDGCQIFAATHSDECIKAALKIFDEKENLDFRLHRLEKKDNKTEIFTFDKEQLEVALETGWEVR